MSVDTVLVDAFNLLLQKGFRPDQAFPQRPTTINFQWSGGGLPVDILLTDPIVVEVPYPARLVWVHMYAGDAVGNPIPIELALELRMTNGAQFGSSAPVYQGGTPPVMADVAFQDVDTTDWLLNFDTGDTFITYPTAYVGTATWFSMTMLLRPTDAPIGIDTVLDNGNEQMQFLDGSDVVFRT